MDPRALDDSGSILPARFCRQLLPPGVLRRHWGQFDTRQAAGGRPGAAAVRLRRGVARDCRLVAAALGNRHRPLCGSPLRGGADRFLHPPGLPAAPESGESPRQPGMGNGRRLHLVRPWCLLFILSRRRTPTRRRPHVGSPNWCRRRLPGRPLSFQRTQRV